MSRSVSEHLDRVLATVGPLAELDLSLLDAHGCVLFEDVAALAAVPPFDAAAVDGYAVRSADVVVTPVTLPVVGDVVAGSTTPLRVQPGLSVRISAGAPLPAGADTVVPLESTDGGVAKVQIGSAPPPGAYIRRAADDVAPGTPVLAAGTHLGAAQIALLAAVGRTSVIVRPRPRVVVLACGPELVDVGHPVGSGQVTDATTYALTTAATEAGAMAYRVGVVPDDARRLRSAIEDHLIRADAVLLTGHVSVASSHVLSDVLAELGHVSFDTVTMTPPLVQGFGVVGHDDTPLFALPGSAVGALVSFELFVRPALRRMLGAEPLHRPVLPAVLGAAVHVPPEVRTYLPARFEMREGKYVATALTDNPDRLSALAGANALIVLDHHGPTVPAGTKVDVMLLERRGR